MKKIIPSDAVLIPETAKIMFKGLIHDTYQWDQVLFNGKTATYEMIKRTDTVIAICVVDGKILVLHEEQPYVGKWINLPGGKVDAEDESTLVATQREIQEETGYIFNTWRLMDVYQRDTKMERFHYIYLATDVGQLGDTNLDAGEKNEVKFYEYAELRRQSLDEKGYMREAYDVFLANKSLEELLNAPEYAGQEVDR